MRRGGRRRFMTEQRTMNTNADSRLSTQKYTIVTSPSGWGVGWVRCRSDGTTWVTLLRTDLGHDDAHDLCDTWNARGTHER